MRFDAACLLLTFAGQAVNAQGYLDEPKRFHTALAQITTAAGGDVDVVDFVADTNEIVVISRDPKGGSGMVQWYIRDVEVLGLHASHLTGPEPVEAGRIKDVGGVSFSLSDFQTKLFAVKLVRAKVAAGLGGRSAISRVDIFRPAIADADTGFDSVRWLITVESAAERAQVIMDGSGTLIAADITGTNRWRDRYFMTQDWPFQKAQEAFRAVVGSAPVVRQIEISAKEVTLTGYLPEAPDTPRAWVWDGGTYEPAVRTVSPAALQGHLPFSLDNVDLSQVNRVRDAALLAIGPDGLIASAIRVTATPGSNGSPVANWEVDVKSPYKGNGFPRAEVSTVILNMDGQVTEIVRPDEKRAAADKTRPNSVVATIAGFRDALGPTTRIYDIYFRQDRVTIKRPHPTEGGMTISIDLREEGLSDGSAFPVMMETDADLFDLDTLSVIDAALIESISRKAVAALGIEGGAVFRISMWSGQPFWRDPTGRPMFDVRVGVPPGFRSGGYAVFTMDGQLVDAIK